MTGTSIATAATSAAAALVWAWRPDLDAGEVADTLHASGAVLDRTADIDLVADVPQRRLDTCAALTRACVGGECVAPACAGRPDDARPDLAALLELAHGDADLVEDDPQPLTPGEDVYDAPYALPQPGVSQCPFCGLQNGLLYGTLVSYDDAVLVGVELHIQDGLGGVTIALPPLPEGVAFKIDTGYFGEVKGAWLTGQLQLDGKTIDGASEIAVIEE